MVTCMAYKSYKLKIFCYLVVVKFNSLFVLNFFGFRQTPVRNYCTVTWYIKVCKYHNMGAMMGMLSIVKRSALDFNQQIYVYCPIVTVDLTSPEIKRFQWSPTVYGIAPKTPTVTYDVHVQSVLWYRDSTTGQPLTSLLLAFGKL